MEIRFSKLTDPVAMMKAVDNAAARCYVAACFASQHNSAYRFTLRESHAPGAFIANERQHDNVIRALLTLDPDATVRTARAVYEGLEDFEKQRGKA